MSDVHSHKSNTYNCSSVDKELTTFPAYGTISKKASLSRRRVIDVIKSLEEKGLIRKEVRLLLRQTEKSRILPTFTPKVKKVDSYMNEKSSNIREPSRNR